ncbi:YifB family Mg chelatase-like AAA ATPase [Pseudoneobacillus sp. C159]
MSVIINSIGLRGMQGYIVKVEVKVINGLNSFTIVGLPDLSVKEAKQRVMATLLSLDNANLLEKKIIVNLSPSEQKKNGPFFDLAIAVGIIQELNLFPTLKILATTAFLGALSLDGSVQPIEGILPAILAAKTIGLEQIICPYHPSLHGLELRNLEIIFVSTFDETMQFLIDKKIPCPTPEWFVPFDHSVRKAPFQRLDFSHIIGHSHAKRALEIAAAGGHHVLMFGPPGCGKSLLAENFPTILPPLNAEQQLEVQSLYQLAAANGASKPALNELPFRQPHHSSSAVSLIGGGSNPKPGEISLAHNGVLFLDEMAEFPKKALDMLRQPLESGHITISRALSTVTYPARFILIAALNPCPCGFRNSNERFCLCSPKQILSYRRKISGPILDRFDIVLQLKSVNFEKEALLVNASSLEPSKTIKKRVIKARERQYQRYGGDHTLNGYATTEQLLKTVGPNLRMLERELQKLAITHHLSTRAQIKIIRLAQTITDLSGIDGITNQALQEAITLHQTEF